MFFLLSHMRGCFLFVGLQSPARRGVMALWMGENSFTKLRFSHRVKPFSAEEEDRTVALFKKGAGSFSAAQEVQSIPMHSCCDSAASQVLQTQAWRQKTAEKDDVVSRRTSKHGIEGLRCLL